MADLILNDSQLRAVATYVRAMIRAESKSVGEVVIADDLEGVSSLPAVKQTGNVSTVVRVPIELLAKPATDAVENLGEIIQKAEEAVDLAKNTAENAQASLSGLDELITASNASTTAANTAAGEANTAAGKANRLPQIIDGYWHFYDDETDDYVNSGTKANGDINYATFEIDPETTELIMTLPDSYDGVTFYINEKDELILKIN